MYWLEDWGYHELSSERGPLTTPEKHNHQTITNQIVSQPKETWIGNNSTLKEVGRDGNCGQDNNVCAKVKAITPWRMDQWFLYICCCVVCLMEHNRGYHDVIGNRQAIATADTKGKACGNSFTQRKEGTIILIITEGTISTITTKRNLDCWQMRQLNWKTEDGR